MARAQAACGSALRRAQRPLGRGPPDEVEHPARGAEVQGVIAQQPGHLVPVGPPPVRRAVRSAGPPPRAAARTGGVRGPDFQPLPARGRSSRSGHERRQHAAVQPVGDPVRQRNRAGRPDHPVAEERLDQRRADQVGLAGRGRPPAGPVHQVEVVERAQRPAGERGGERGQAGQVRRGRGRAQQAQAAGGQAAEQFGPPRLAPGPGRAAVGPGGGRVAAAQQLTAVPAGLHRLGGHLRVGPADVLERRQHAVGDQHRRAEPGQHVRLVRAPAPGPPGAAR